MDDTGENPSEETEASKSPMAINANINWSMLLDDSRLYGLPFGVAVATVCSTFIYRKTGNIWLCGILVGVIACLMCVLYGQTGFHYLTYSAPLS